MPNPLISGPLQVTADPAADAAEAAAEQSPKVQPEDARFLRRVLRILGVDRAIGYTILARGWSSVAGLVTVALIARTLSGAEQGYYYTFGSLVALQLIFELGFSVVILQLATHEVAHLRLHEDGRILGDARGQARLASILQKAVRWYSVAAVLLGVVLLPVGWHFFAGSGGPVAWRGPWCAVVIASCFTFQVDPIFSFLEGCGFVSRVALTRFTQALLGSALAWTALARHHGLYAPALLIAGQAVAGGYFLWTRRALLRNLFRLPAGEHAIDWGVEVWPFQWRIAVSYASGFLIFQLFNPVLFKFFGPAIAGQMGMSLNIANALGSVAIAWINTKAAPFGAMIARREFVALDSLFFRSAVQTLLLCACGSVLVWTASVMLLRHHVAFAHRLLPPLPFALLLTTMCLNQVVASMAMYLRAHKQEKFLLNSVLGGLLVALSTLTVGRWFGPVGMTAGHLSVTLFVGVGMGAYTFVRYRRLWHA